MSILLICPEFESLAYSKPPWIIRIISLNCLCLTTPAVVPRRHSAISHCISLLHPFLLSCIYLFYQPHAWDSRNCRSDGAGHLFFTLWHVLSSACDFKHYIMDSANLRQLETWIDLESQTGKKKKLKRDC